MAIQLAIVLIKLFALDVVVDMWLITKYISTILN